MCVTSRDSGHFSAVAMYYSMGVGGPLGVYTINEAGGQFPQSRSRKEDGVELKRYRKQVVKKLGILVHPQASGVFHTTSAFQVSVHPTPPAAETEVRPHFLKIQKGMGRRRREREAEKQFGAAAEATFPHICCC